MSKQTITMKVNLNSIEKVKNFCKQTIKLSGLLKVSDDVFTVDGKSILGIFSLNLTKNVTLIYEYDTNNKNEDIKILKDIINTL